MLINDVYITSLVTKSQPKNLQCQFRFDLVGPTIEAVDGLLGGLVAVVRPEVVAASALDATDPNVFVGLVIDLHVKCPLLKEPLLYCYNYPKASLFLGKYLYINQ